MREPGDFALCPQTPIILFGGFAAKKGKCVCKPRFLVGLKCCSYEKGENAS